MPDYEGVGGQECLKKDEPVNMINEEEKQEELLLFQTQTQTSASAGTTDDPSAAMEEGSSSGQDLASVELREDPDHPAKPPVHDRPYFSKEKRMITTAIACCLLVLVVIVVTVATVLGTKSSDEETRNNTTPSTATAIQIQATASPAIFPTDLMSTEAPSSTAIISEEVQQWAEEYLPNQTLTMIQSTTVNTTVNTTNNSQWKALNWIQTDSYFQKYFSSSDLATNETKNRTVAAAIEEKLLNRYGLATLFYSLNGDSWLSMDENNTESAWLSGLDECLWAYYSCDNETNTTTASSFKSNAKDGRQLSAGGAQLELVDRVTAGTLPPEVSLLSSLQGLKIYQTPTNTSFGLGIQGTLPTEIGLMTNLVALHLQNNNLVGTIPSELGMLTRLQTLSLYSNSLDAQGTVPREVCNLKIMNLQQLSVDCDSVVCNCGCDCLTGGASNHTQSEENIFYHNNDTTASISNETGYESAAIGHNTTTGAANTTSNARLCNGMSNLCDMELNKVMFPLLHNAMATSEDNFLLANHEGQLENALQAGFRGVNLDICNCGGKIVFCHAYCFLGTRDPLQVFENIYDFLQAMPDEVLVFSFQIDNDAGSDVNLTEFYEILELIPGFTDMLYMHNVPDEEKATWPTLGSLIDSDKVC